jgi:hypothetical protein
MKPLSIKVVMDPESVNKLSSANIYNLTISGTTLKIGRESYDIHNLESMTLAQDILTMSIDHSELKFGVQTFGLKNITDEYLTEIFYSWVLAIRSNDQTSMHECVTRIQKAKRSHEIRAAILFIFFPVWLICFPSASEMFAGWFADSISHQTAIGLGCGTYAVLMAPIWVWIFKKGDGFAFEVNNKKSQSMDLTQ